MNNPWIKISQPSRNIKARRIDSQHPLNLFWAKDFRGRYLFLFDLEERSTFPVLPELAGIQALITEDEGRFSFVLILSEAANWEMFFALCQDLVHVSKNSKTNSSGFNVILARLFRWHEFLKKARSSILSEEAIKGLLGELLFLKRHLIPHFGASAAINFWTGPEGSPQDFCINNIAFEVKCQSGTTSPKIKISNIDQLCSQLPEMYLWVLTLGKSHKDEPDSVNLPDIIKSIYELLEQESTSLIDRFEDLLFQMGYFDLEQYTDFAYIVASEMCFEVKNDFPRLCPDNINTGIVNVSYGIELNACLPFEGKPDWM
ncbi:PD-(D/E)XK motif protein [Desulfovibrio sp. JC022]|uniref:PD-(D/E)XK motif protein n=1 Tax=Desulfovibrio sp. JC022 TaxID=2593642 RepID=UPI0013D55A0D|nr:PD-(D/E)XK motif protein [Desulfovibrio sp. JC022]NDV24327.1 PD-(D/E)XK motif protein [Desulfovibrio sp. JC022]